MTQTASLTPPRPRAFSVWPREHGALFELVLPLGVTHWLSRPSTAGWLFTACALAGFMAHEPLLVLLGRRGLRPRAEHSTRALQWLGAWFLVGLVTGLGAMVTAPAQARVAMALPAILALPAMVKIARGTEHTLRGEILVAAALTACSVPVGIANGMALGQAVSMWAVWSIGTTCASWSVHAMVGARKRGLDWVSRVLPLSAVAFLWPVARLADWLQTREFLAGVPLLAASLVLAGWAPHPRHLRRAGWSLVVASLATAIILASA